MKTIPSKALELWGSGAGVSAGGGWRLAGWGLAGRSFWRCSWLESSDVSSAGRLHGGDTKYLFDYLPVRMCKYRHRRD